MAQERTAVRAPPAIQRRPAVCRGVQRSAPENPRSPGPALQRRLGNHGAQIAAQLIARSSAPGRPSEGVTPAGPFSLSQPGDAHEREADRVADQVMRMPEPQSLSAVRPPQTIERAFVECEGEVQRQPLAPLPVTHEKPQLVDVYVESFFELAAAARRPTTKRVFIVGSGLEYFKNHGTSQEIRRDFFLMLQQKVKNQKTNSGNLTGTYGAGLRSYGSLFSTSLFSKGTWMVGKTDEPKIDYVAKYSKVSVDSWNVAFKAKWKIIDDFDFRPDKDKSMRYKAFAVPFGVLWHDVAGGKEDVPVHIQWEEGGSFMIQPALPPTVTTYGATPTQGK